MTSTPQKQLDSRRCRRAPALLAGVVLSLIPSLSFPDMPAGEATLDLQAGYDNEVLVDPERIGVIEPVEAPFASAALGVRFRLDGGRLAAGFGSSAARYGDDGPEGEYSLRSDLRYYRTVAGNVLVETGAGLGRFRRENLPLFDLDYVRTALGVTVRVGGRWYGGFRADLGFLSLPGRLIEDGSDETESDRNAGLSLTLLRQVSSASFIEMSAGLRRTVSNDSLVEQTGPVFALRGNLGGRDGFLFSPAAVVQIRSYHSYPVLEYEDGSFVDGGEDRRDVTWRLGGTLTRRITPLVSLLADAAVIRQTSNIRELEFDQVRFILGARLHLWNREESILPAIPPPSLAPLPLGDGRFRFYFRAPNARNVSLVGGFNGWKVEETPMALGEREGVWEAVLSIPPGTWRYAFVADGKWEAPPGAGRYEEDGFGGTIGLIDAGL